MRFLHPSFLVLVPVAFVFAALAYWLLLRSRGGLDAFMSRKLRERLAPGSATDHSAIQIAFLAMGLALLAVAIARPQWGRADAPVRTRGRNLLIALDVSRSMLAADVHPNRLERARVDIMDLLGDLGGDRAGLLVFRGKANMICPLTTDRAFLRQALDGVTIDSAPRGETDLADAIRKSVAAFDGMADENNAVILISDGEDLAGRAKTAAEEAGARSIPIFTVGIGDPSGADVPAAEGSGAMKYKGETVRSRMTETTLREIASASGGAYIPLATSSTASTTLGAIYRQHLAKIAAKEMEEMIENRLVERYQLFLVPGLLLLLAAAALSRGRLAKATRASAMVLAMVLIAQRAVLAADGATEGSYADTAWRAQSLYAKGDYTNAAALFLDAANRCDDPERARSLKYDSALASYKAGDLDAASSALSSIYSYPRQTAAAELFGATELARAYGTTAVTNAAVKAEALERASDGFANALRATPDDTRAKRNLARAASGIGAAREAARIEAALAKHGGKPPQALIGEILSTERSLLRDVAKASESDDAEGVISALEDAAERQREASYIWMPLEPYILEGLTNDEDRAYLTGLVRDAREAMHNSADLLDDLSPEAYPNISLAENIAYDFWTAAADPPALIAEDILVQTNAYVSPSASLYPTRDDWEEAYRLTFNFALRFPKWAEQVIQQRQADTNAPPFTAENAAKINELAEELKWLQNDALKNPEPSNRRSAALEALDKLEKIKKLLPKNKSQSQPQQQQQQQQQDQQDQQNQDQQDQQQEQQQEQQDNQQQEQNEEQSQEQQQEQAAEASDKDIDEALRKALEREKEHDRDKQRRMRSFPLSPGARDW